MISQYLHVRYLESHSWSNRRVGSDSITVVIYLPWIELVDVIFSSNKVVVEVGKDMVKLK